MIPIPPAIRRSVARRPVPRSPGRTCRCNSAGDGPKSPADRRCRSRGRSSRAVVPFEPLYGDQRVPGANQSVSTFRCAPLTWIWCLLGSNRHFIPLGHRATRRHPYSDHPFSASMSTECWARCDAAVPASLGRRAASSCQSLSQHLGLVRGRFSPVPHPRRRNTPRNRRRSPPRPSSRTAPRADPECRRIGYVTAESATRWPVVSFRPPA